MVPALLRISLWSVLTLSSSGACSVVNKDHCGNQDGDATCVQRDPGAPYCSLCVADNDGCLAAAPPSECLADPAPATTADTSSTTGSSTTRDPTTGTTSTSTGTDPVTSTGTATSSGTASDITSSTGTTTSTSDTTDTTDTTSTGGPVCGNNKIEGDEVCDGTDFGGETCKTVVPDKWGGGSLGCNECTSLNDGKCCVGLAGVCGMLNPDAALPCCPGLTCKFEKLGTYTCQSQ